MSGLLGAAEIREIATRLGVRPTKKLGQNFVVDSNTCRKIVKSAGVGPDDVALEIGPGLGSLTLAMLESAREVIAIEIDERLALELPATAARHGFDNSKLQVICQDAMATSTLPLDPTVLVANLPYNVSVPVLLRFLELFPTLRSGVVMVQSEVADRLVAKPGSKTYGSPSVKAAWWADLTAAGTVSRSIFWPVPNVDSSLVRFVRHENPGDEQLRRATFKVIDFAFAQRRKMMRAALSELCGGSSQASAILEASGIDPTIRGEGLELSNFIKIAITLSK
ncbi:MAG: 16S rRNA (adenine(1518)-N(6)/adenine(1519)-N(6))-dimethyltransferase RsmA [SAR202 cluster bacterium]|jgi:16S rRNA (adenine1518-N6/adenine1519-N6)-dimethyltransferase|nr:16S rRNA (adenine(1518)-N(6)/adenine(1519)-N(6))-dimethyltransferase RsmA [SAR202 cluster bacterium]|tara:strand:+ start:733 stop:1572 length:840 start_codon:yes stop_codon:yes gene_type:complete